MLELVQVDLGDSDPVGQAPPEPHLQGALEAPEEDAQAFCSRMVALGLRGAQHFHHRLAQNACRSHVESRENLAESPE